MGFLSAIQVCIRKSIEFNGRASRSEFWWFLLFWQVVQYIIFSPSKLLSQLLSQGEFGFFFIVTFVAMQVPLTSVSVRRLHDLGRPTKQVLIPIAALWPLFIFIYSYASFVIKNCSAFLHANIVMPSIYNACSNYFEHTFSESLRPLLVIVVLAYLPFYVPIALLWWLLLAMKPGNSYANEYGPNPIGE